MLYFVVAAVSLLSFDDDGFFVVAAVSLLSFDVAISGQRLDGLVSASVVCDGVGAAVLLLSIQLDSLLQFCHGPGPTRMRMSSILFVNGVYG